MQWIFTAATVLVILVSVGIIVLPLIGMWQLHRQQKREGKKNGTIH